MNAVSSNGPIPKDSTQGMILVVDDNQNVTRALSFLLKDAGYRPVVFHQGQAALAFSRDEIPVAALVDIHLPDINGLVLSQKLRDQFGPDVPIIVLSGDTSMENLKSLPHVGATYFFSKPVNSASLLERLKEWLQ